METNPSVICIISLVCPGPTLGDLRAVVRLADQLNAPDDLELLDGSHARIVEEPEIEVGRTLGGLRSFVAARTDVAASTEIVDAASICVDLPVYAITTVGCGEHLGTCPANLLVTVNRECADAHD